MGNVPLRRFVDLEVDEVSLVDSPANEKEFAILKRVEDEMPGDVKEVIEKEATSNDEKLEEKTVSKEVTVDPEKVVNEAVTKAIEKVTGLIETIAKKENEKNEEEPAKEVAEKVGEEKPEVAPEAVPEVIPEATPEAVEVEKAKSFTPTRIQALKDVAATIQALVGEIAEAAQPEKEVSKSAEKDETHEVFKSLVESLGELKTSFQSFQETSKSLSGRLDEIEKTVQPSQSVEDEGGTDTEVKKDNNIWKGLL